MQDLDYMADFDDKAEDMQVASAKSKDIAAAPAGKSALRRKVVGRGQTSLSSPSPMVLPGTAKLAQSPSLPDSVVSSPVGSVKSAEGDDQAKHAPVAMPQGVPPVADAITAPVAATPDSDALNVAPEAPVKRGVGRPRKVAVGASTPAAKPVLTQRPAAKPSLAKPMVAKPHPIEPAAKPVATKSVATKSLRLKAVPASPLVEPTASAAVPAGKVAATAAAASRPALRAARIINSVSTPDPTPSSATSIKDLTMDMSANFNGFQGAMSEAQAKAQAAFEKSQNMLGEAGDFAKGNVEAMVEASKIFAEGVQEIGSTLVAESRTAFESMTGDIKELAAAKSPTDFLKLQSDLVRKNFDTAVSYSSKSSETFLKLMSDAFAPLSGRVSLAVEKARQVAPMSAPTNIAA
jgi:phasin family protein